jgi:hypothetical protein
MDVNSAFTESSLFPEGWQKLLNSEMMQHRHRRNGEVIPLQAWTGP